MLRVNYYINGKKVDEPLNHEELSLELNFDKDDPSFNGQVSVNNWDIGLGNKNDKDGAFLIQKYINQGLVGGTGVFEGIDFKIELQNGSEYNTLFDGYLDLSTSNVLCKQINATAVEAGGIDWLNNIADSFDFEFLYELDDPSNGFKGKIYDSDFVPVPYLLSSVPDIYTAAITGVSLYTVLNQFYESISSLIEKVPELIFPNFGNIISLILVSIQLTLLQIASIILTVQLYRLLVPKVKYHAGMYVYTLCEKACEYLDLEFSSTILEKDPFSKMLILPETYQQFEAPDNVRKRFIEFSKALVGVQDLLDFDRVGFYRGTFGDLLRELKKAFNAKIIIQDGVLSLEKKDFIINESLYRMPNIDKSDIPFRFNSEEYYSYAKFSFTKDESEVNTIQNYIGTTVTELTYPKVINKRKQVIGGNKNEIQLKFARGIRRTKKNFIERMFGDIFDNMTPIINEINTIRDKAKRDFDKIKKKLNKPKKILSNLGIKFNKPQPIQDISDNIDKYLNDLRDLIFRKANVLLLEKDAVNVPKLLLMEADYYNWKDEAFVKLDTRNDLIINAFYLYKTFYDIDTFTGTNHNQHKIYTVNVPFCYDDYILVKNNNIIYDSDGITKATIISLKWNIYEQTAEIEYKVREKYTDNLESKTIIDDGR